ncbi:hypothetical protein VKI21_05055 [Cyanobacterium aponinum UTEX 3222]|uniref:Uncharacterized protein n=2 Tax=Cyanobacterium aponinum TaxID=379064 RepID=K9Z8A5_CYAAP|nr:hypothetical protein [Cyanobacterium aponinum]AFZ54962.1 hypothetical protein Cyan10605_2900 [Cyanobacterium aponinum PCC 10605]MTF40585.1 hypothetical protein [Cyanobacterium aponinum 0216]WRL40160.1 hypothetical protein VKI22_08805 [Cyanobacterium aponinum UTEX 3221]WRL43054.1 hypothetical protein VKI21_05055 [Cyanobacterium aponinum UTEX 3222]
MEATKVIGMIDNQGQLIIKEKINLSPGKVEIVILKSENINIQDNEKKESKIKFKNQTFRDLLENQNPTDENYDVDEQKWSYLKEKHNL